MFHEQFTIITTNTRHIHKPFDIVIRFNGRWFWISQMYKNKWPLDINGMCLKVDYSYTISCVYYFSIDFSKYLKVSSNILFNARELLVFKLSKSRASATVLVTFHWESAKMESGGIDTIRLVQSGLTRFRKSTKCFAPSDGRSPTPSCWNNALQHRQCTIYLHSWR